MSVGEWIGIALLGGAGAALRFRLDGYVQQRAAGELPVGTLVVNVIGAFGAGLLTGLAVGDTALLLAGTGLLGSFTTFSTWMLESERLAEEGEERLALVNVVMPLACGIVERDRRTRTRSDWPRRRRPAKHRWCASTTRRSGGIMISSGRPITTATCCASSRRTRAINPLPPRAASCADTDANFAAKSRKARAFTATPSTRCSPQ